eukprot:1117719-Pleurochrysis_carterae.AAC.2
MGYCTDNSSVPLFDSGARRWRRWKVAAYGVVGSDSIMASSAIDVLLYHHIYVEIKYLSIELWIAPQVVGEAAARRQHSIAAHRTPIPSIAVDYPTPAAQATMASRIVFLVAVCMVTTDAFSSLGEVVAEQQAVTVAFTEFGNKFFEDDAAGLQPFFADGARAVIFDKVTHETFVFEPGEVSVHFTTVHAKHGKIELLCRLPRVSTTAGDGVHREGLHAGSGL